MSVDNKNNCGCDNNNRKKNCHFHVSNHTAFNQDEFNKVVVLPLSPVPIEVFNLSPIKIVDYTYIYNAFVHYSAMQLVFYSKVSTDNYNVRVVNVNTSTTIANQNISSNGFTTVNITKPTADCDVAIYVYKLTNTDPINNPTMTGLAIKYS